MSRSREVKEELAIGTPDGHETSICEYFTGTRLAWTIKNGITKEP